MSAVHQAAKRAAARMLTVAQRIGESGMLADAGYLRAAADELLSSVREAETSQRMPLDADVDLSDQEQLELASRPMELR